MSTPKRTPLTVSAAVIRMIRQEGNPNLTNYSILLALANSVDEQGTPVPLTGPQLAEATGDNHPQTAHILRLKDKGLIIRTESAAGEDATYQLTPLGAEEAVRIAQGRLLPKPGPTPDMEKVKAALAKH